METQELIDWLLKEGGPVLRYLVLSGLVEEASAAERERALQEVLRTEKVGWLLAQMGRFGPINHVDIRVLNELHGMKPTCLENVIPRLLERGLRAGIAEFYQKMERFLQYVSNPLVTKAIEDTDNPTVENGRAMFIAIVLASNFLRAGYDHDEVWRLVEGRIERLSRLAGERNFAVHLNGDELAGLPKQWVGKPILRPQVDPTLGTTPLPLIHDIFALAYLPAKRLTAEIRQKVDLIVTYTLDERYRAFPPGYGYLWFRDHPRTCYACGWNLDLPDMASANPYEQRKIVQRMELLAHFPAAHSSSWFQHGLRLLESFRTEKGTFCLPSQYLIELSAGYYVGGDVMGLEENRRSGKALELESTFRMLRLKQMLKGEGYAL